MTDRERVNAMTISQIGFFTENIKWSAEGCWEWLASRTIYGYGQWSVGEYSSLKNFRAHRLSYLLMVGDISEGLQLDHLCRNRGCVNPAHLEPVTSRENVRRGSVPVETRGNRCPRGHEYTVENTYLTRLGAKSCKKCTRRANRLWLAKVKDTPEYRERKRATDKRYYWKKKLEIKGA